MDPVELQVMGGALRAICDEMGAVLIRSAHSANIKERRDASTALFDRSGQMVMQAEHIPVHLGAMPAAVAAVLEQDHEPGPQLDSQRPVSRRHPPAGHHRDHARVRRSGRRADRVRRQPRPPRGRRRPDARVDARRQPHARRRGGGDRTARAGPERDRRAQLPDAPARPAPRRPESAARRRTGRRDPPAGAPRTGRSGRPDGRRSRRCSTTPSDGRARACTDLEDGVRTARDVLEAADGSDLELQLKATVDGDRLVLDFTGSAPQHDGNLNCPLAVTRSACYFAVRVLTDPDIPPSAGAYRPIDVRRSRGVHPQRALARRGRGRQRRDLEPRRRPRPRGVRARARSGDDEQPHARRRARGRLLRDDRRRPGGVCRRRWPERRSRRDEQHAQHADRGARAGVPAACSRIRDQARLRRRRPAIVGATGSFASSRRWRRCATR